MLRMVVLLLSLTAWNSYAQDECENKVPGNDILNIPRLCAPVEVIWKAWYTAADYADPGNIFIIFDWDDGTRETIAATHDPITKRWEATQSHIYPKAGIKCNYNISVTLVVDGVICYNSTQTQLITVWDTDDENGGEMTIAPQIFPICFGNDGTVVFNDASLWNCVPPVEYDTRNNRRRWIQWIYGTGGTNITTAQVNSTVRAYPFEGPVEITGQPIEGPVPPMNQSMPIYIPDNYNVGDFFEVTIRNWNQCNPYDQGYDPVETTAIALIVALPDGSIGLAGPFCDNAPSVLLNRATPGGTWSGPGMTDPTSRRFHPDAAGSGIHTIEYFVTDGNGCSATGSTVIEVWESPSVTLAEGDPVYLCPGLDKQLEANITGGTSPYNILWTGNTAPLSSNIVYNPIFSTTSIGTYNLTVAITDDKNCSTTRPMSVIVEPVEVNFSPSDLEICQFTNTVLEPIVTGGTRNFVEHVWTGSDINKLTATNIANPGMNTDATGSFNFIYNVTDDMGCSDSNNISALVKEAPQANAGNDASICGLFYTLNATPWAGATGQWTLASGSGTIGFSDNSSATSNITVSTTGTYTLQWHVDMDGCSDTDDLEITFAPLPKPTVIDDFSKCGVTATIQANTDIGTGIWSQGANPGNAILDDATQNNTNITIDQPGEYTFIWTETTSSNCAAHAELKVTFLPTAQALVEPLPVMGCSPLEITFPNQSAHADSYLWDFGGGVTSTEETPTFVYENFTSNIRNYQVTLVASNQYNCNDSQTFSLAVAPKPRANAIVAPSAGCSPLESTFTNLSAGATTFRWEFSDGTAPSTETNPQHTFLNNNNYVIAYPVTLYAENNFGCEDSILTQVTVYPPVSMNLDITPDSGCHPLEAILTATPGALFYEWDMDDGSSFSGNFQARHVFSNLTIDNRNYNVTVTGVNAFSCRASASARVTVYPSPDAQFMATPIELQMPDREVTITNQTEGSGWNYFWQFGDDTTSDLEEPISHTYQASGQYTILLTVNNEHCSDQTSRNILIRPMLPQIEYGDPANGCPPLTVSFYNNTLDATSFLWEFGDGMMSQETSPTHTYNVSGTYVVKLTASGSGGISVSDDIQIVVHDKPLALFEVVPKVIYIPGEKPRFINRSVGATLYEWDFGDGTQSDAFSPDHQFDAPGIYNISLRATNNEGCEDLFSLREAIKVEQGGELNFPNAFTPNPGGQSGGRYEFGDPRNHVFYPFTQKGIVEYRLQIFTRWGELLFESNDVEIGWDGYHKGRLAAQGVYIWRVRYKTADGKVNVRAGDVTLIR
jgi:gliding motility-associated-like protein